MNRLLVILSDHVPELLHKGELTPRYYNPGELFGEVHLLLTNDDPVRPEDLQFTVGDASLKVHHLPLGRRLFLRTLGWRAWRLNQWARPAVELTRAIRPTLIRCYGHYLNAFVAYRIHRALGVPYLVSVHTNPDEDIRRRAEGLAARLSTRTFRRVERLALRGAHLVLPVYQPILPYLSSLGVERVEVAYNTVNPRALRPKRNYRLHRPIRVISVGRQLRFKNPANLLRAVANLSNVHLTLVGDGPVHDDLVRLAKHVGASDWIVFERALPNDEVCARLAESDIFAVHSEFWELSKSVLEALLTGLPVVINERRGEPVPELQAGFVLVVPNTPDGYGTALGQLINDAKLREKLGRAGRAAAEKSWSPKTTEANFVRIYRRALSETRRFATQGEGSGS